MNLVSNVTAAKLAQAAYPGGVTPAGWTPVDTKLTPDGKNAVTLYVNNATSQAVLAFKGSDNLSNFQSDAIDSGATEWAAIKPYAQQLLQEAKGSYPQYSISTTGHSLGGGMAQTMALLYGLDGFGFNSLPVAADTINNEFLSVGLFNSAVSAWKQQGHTFSEFNLEADPATMAYRGQAYISTSTTQVNNPWAACTALAPSIASIPLLGNVGKAVVAYCAYESHSIDTMVDQMQGSSGDKYGGTTQLDQYLANNSALIINAFDSVPLVASSTGQVVAKAADGEQISVTPISSGATSASYSVLSSTQSPRSYTEVTGSGGTLALSNTSIGVVANVATTVTNSGTDTVALAAGDSINISHANLNVAQNGAATVAGNNDTVSAASGDNVTVTGQTDTVSAAAGDRVTIGGNGMNSSTIDTVNANGAVVALEANSRVNVTDAYGTVSGAANDNFGVLGKGAQVNAVAGDGVWVGGNGATAADNDVDTVRGNGATVILSPDTRANIFGNNDVVDGAARNNFGVYGSGDWSNAVAGDGVWTGGNGAAAADSAIDTVSGTGATVTLQGGSRVNVNDSNATIYGAANDNFGATGSGLSVYAAPGDGVWVGGNGASGALDTVYAPAATVLIDGNSRVNVVNTQPTTAEGVYAAAGDVVDLNGGNQVLSAVPGVQVDVNSTNGRADAITAAGDTAQTRTVDGGQGGIYLGPNTQANIAGGGDTITGSAGDTIGVGDGGNAVIYGPSERIWLTGTGSNADALYGTGDNGGTAADGQQAGIWADNGTHFVNSGGGDRIVGGVNDAIGIANTAGRADVLTGSGDVLYPAPNVQLNTYGSGDSVSTPASTSGGDVLNIQGHDDPVQDNYSTIDYYGGQFTNDTVSGVGDIVSDIGGFMAQTAGGTGGASMPAQGAQGTDAIVLNLQGGAVQTTALAGAKARYDVDNSGDPVPTGWVTPGEGVLVNLADGSPSHGASLVKGTTALAMLDTNHDGVLDAKDSLWNQLQVWIDQDGSAQVKPGELHSLASLGITALDLNAASANRDDRGNRIISTGSFRSGSGATGQFAGVELASGPATLTPPALASGGADNVASGLPDVIHAMAAFSPDTGATSQIGNPLAANDPALLLAPRHSLARGQSLLAA